MARCCDLPSGKKILLLHALNACMALYPLGMVAIYLYDQPNTNLSTRGAGKHKIDRDIFNNYQHHQIGFYPLGGILTLCTASIFDVLAVGCYLTGVICGVTYENNYVIVNTMNLFMTGTGILLLFKSGPIANDYMNNFFRVALFHRYNLLETYEGFLNEPLNTTVPISNADCRFVDSVQFWQSCCGFEGPDDWQQARNFDQELMLLPLTCCAHGDRSYCILGTHPVHKQGCKNLVYPTFYFGRIAAHMMAICKFFLVLLTMISSSMVFREKWSIPNKPLVSRRHSMYPTMSNLMESARKMSCLSIDDEDSSV